MRCKTAICADKKYAPSQLKRRVDSLMFLTTLASGPRESQICR